PYTSNTPQLAQKARGMSDDAVQNHIDRAVLVEIYHYQLQKNLLEDMDSGNEEGSEGGSGPL
ncbi:MAG TPA: hypothetical protein GX691_04575, partial [Clostridia bacterium]|nr:hypothetical protein [Clostridia bacterium]